MSTNLGILQWQNPSDIEGRASLHVAAFNSDEKSIIKYALCCRHVFIGELLIHISNECRHFTIGVKFCLKSHNLR